MTSGPAASFFTRFPLASDEWIVAASIAGCCSDFSPDTEEEQVADESMSCYNCRYRRWLANAADCGRRLRR